MTQSQHTIAQWWAGIPEHEVRYLAGAAPQLLRIALDPVPEGAPAVVWFRPVTGGPLRDHVAVLLDELDRAALALYPAWLPEAGRPAAGRLDGPQGHGGTARGVAGRLAGHASRFRPFLADVVVRALRVRGGAPGSASRFPASVRAAGLGRILASAYGRPSVALLVELPPDLGPIDEHTLASAAEWLAEHGRFSVWLAGTPLRTVDRIASVQITLPDSVTELRDVHSEPDAARRRIAALAPLDPRTAALTFPALPGLPRADSVAEQALERALRRHEWARGRCWNHTLTGDLLAKPYRVDLLFSAERLVVEVDGHEHTHPVRLADDRRRDGQLQSLGYAVLRFTDEQVLMDVPRTVLTIRQSLAQRREAPVR